jgi:hypothetical protein
MLNPHAIGDIAPKDESRFVVSSPRCFDRRRVQHLFSRRKPVRLEPVRIHYWISTGKGQHRLGGRLRCLCSRWDGPWRDILKRMTKPRGPIRMKSVPTDGHSVLADLRLKDERIVECYNDGPSRFFLTWQDAFTIDTRSWLGHDADRPRVYARVPATGPGQGSHSHRAVNHRSFGGRCRISCHRNPCFSIDEGLCALSVS